MLFLSAGATTVVAQDATNCNSNSSISHEAVRAGNFKDAYTPWKAVLENCPTLRFYTFTDGYKILKGLMGQIKDRNNPTHSRQLSATDDTSLRQRRRTCQLRRTSLLRRILDKRQYGCTSAYLHPMGNFLFLPRHRHGGAYQRKPQPSDIAFRSVEVPY